MNQPVGEAGANEASSAASVDGVEMPEDIANATSGGQALEEQDLHVTTLSKTPKKVGTVRRLGQFVLSGFRRVDEATHGYVPLFCWLVLLFGGIWFPATPILEHVFEDAETPRGLLFGTSRQVKGEVNAVASSTPTATEATETQAKKVTRIQHLVPSTAAMLLIPCLFFWSWTNIGLLCVMASAMGEVNRCAENPDDRPNFRSSCTRAFFVYLFVLLNELAVAGSLTAGIEIQGTYTRVAILASLFSFVSSYRPTFYAGLVMRFSTSEDGRKTQGQQQSQQRSVGPEGGDASIQSELTSTDENVGLNVSSREFGDDQGQATTSSTLINGA